MVELLLRTTYETRSEAMAFGRFAMKGMEGERYVMGTSTPCVHRHESEPSRVWRHGENVIFAGEPHFVDCMTANLRGAVKLEIRARMGVGPGEDRHIAVLNRELSQDVLDGRGTCVCRSIFGGRSFDEQKEWAYRARLTDVHVESKHVGLRRWTSWWPRQEGWLTCLTGEPQICVTQRISSSSWDERCNYTGREGRRQVLN